MTLCTPLLALALATAPALAEEPSHDTAHSEHPEVAAHEHVEAEDHDGEVESDAALSGHEMRATRGLFAVRALTGVVLGQTEERGRWGAGVFYEHPLIPHKLEIKVQVGSMVGDIDAVLTTDVLFEIPVQLGPHWELHAGLGPMLELLWAREAGAHGERPSSVPILAPGGAANVDIYAWPADKVGLMIEADVAVVAIGRRAHAELELGFGVAFHL